MLVRTRISDIEQEELNKEGDKPLMLITAHDTVICCQDVFSVIKHLFFFISGFQSG